MVRSRRILCLLAAFYLVMGIAMTFLPDKGPTSPLDLLLGIPTLAAVYSWCRAEATERGELTPGRSAVWAALLPPIFLPVYFFRTRPPASALWTTAKSLALYLMLVLIAVIGGTLASLLQGAS